MKKKSKILTKCVFFQQKQHFHLQKIIYKDTNLIKFPKNSKFSKIISLKLTPEFPDFANNFYYFVYYYYLFYLDFTTFFKLL